METTDSMTESVTSEEGLEDSFIPPFQAARSPLEVFKGRNISETQRTVSFRTVSLSFVERINVTGFASDYI